MGADPTSAPLALPPDLKATMDVQAGSTDNSANAFMLDRFLGMLIFFEILTVIDCYLT